jgi:hypothetical protein
MKLLAKGAPHPPGRYLDVKLLRFNDLPVLLLAKSSI